MKRKLLIIGSNGMVGSALLRIAKKRSSYKILYTNRKMQNERRGRISRNRNSFTARFTARCAG